MNPDQKKRLFELFTAHAADSLTPAEHAELQEVLRSDAEARLMWFVHQDVEMGLHAHLEAAPISQMRAAPPSTWRGRLSWRPLTAAAAGIVFGMFCASVAWAYTSPRLVAEARRLEALVDGSFEKLSGPMPSEFPVTTGVWRGDESEVVEGRMVKARDGKKVLRFLHAEGNAKVPNNAASACDVYQIIDLRPLRGELKTAGESMLELSAEFLDARTTPGAPVVFACHVYLFEGTPESLHTLWPPAARDTLGVGASYSVSKGGPEAGGWRKVTARCVLTPQADVAVVKLSAGRGDRQTGLAPALGAQFADDVKLVLKTQPVVPVRFVQH